MPKFLMLGSYTSHSTQGISKARKRQIESLIIECGGQLQLLYGLLGTYDLLILAEFPSNEVAVRASLSITKMTGITFSSQPAVEIADLDELVEV
jgi:uncharacterized protein with GYD domain